MNKKILFGLLILVLFNFTSCCKVTSTEQSLEAINDIIPSDYKYISYSESSEISEILNSNPIDELYFKEWKDAITTADITNLYQKYLSIWQSELDAVVEKIEKNLSDEELDDFQASQEAWELFYKTNPNIAVDMYTSKMGVGSIVHEIYGNKSVKMIRYRTLELAEYCYLLTGKFEFIFNQ